jgi:hypothetical protein
MGIENFFKQMDMISDPPASKLHFGNDTKHKSVLGGICTLLCAVSFTVTAIYQAYNIIIMKNIDVHSIEVPYQYDHPVTKERWEMKMSEGYKLIFSIGDWD